MDKLQGGIFRLAAARMRWADARQGVLAHNVANADTPGFAPRDTHTFADVLRGTTAMARAGALSKTDVLHLAGTLADPSVRGSLVRPPGRAPDGNAVSLDQQLTAIADTQTTHQVASTIFVKYENFFRTAWGRVS